MKKIKLLTVSFIGIVCADFNASAQNYIDKYLTDPLTYTTIGTSANSLSSPKDLDFKPNTNELWVANYGTSNGGTMVIFYNAGQTNQTSQFRKDTHSSHFMRNTSAFAFGDNGEWACTSEIQNTNSNSPTFMGPALWLADTNIFARVFQNNWVNGYPLGSHIDMLHQSPFAMGIAHDSLKAYWVFDGYNGNICKYDFVTDHSPGYDDHSAGKIWRYVDVTVTRVPNIPSHMVLDKNSKWLYFIDGGSKTIRRLNTLSGNVTGTLTVPATGQEPLAGYWKVQNETVEIFDTLTTQPCGIDLYNDRLIVSDYTTGDILIYDTSTPTPSLLGTVATGQPGIMGVKIGTDGKIWFVNNTQNTLVRIDPLPAADDASILEITSPLPENFEPKFYSVKFNTCAGSVVPVVTLKNEGTNTLTSVDINYTIDGGPVSTFNWSGSLATGATTSVTLASSSILSGSHKIVAYTSTPNGNTDLNPLNDKKEGSFRTIDPLMSFPYTETFTTAVFPPSGWSYIGHNKYCKMSRVANVGGFGMGLGCLKMDNYAGTMNVTGQNDYFISQRIDLSAAPPVTTLEFDVAYARYDNNSNDKLDVKISTDCGSTWTSVYTKSGSVLSTAPNTTSAFTPSATQWRKEYVALSAYTGQPDVMFMFTSTSNWGNNLYIDNIKIINSTGISEYDTEISIDIYPNPSAGQVVIHSNASNDRLTDVEVINILGESVMKVRPAGNETFLQVDLSSCMAGAYFVKVKTEKGITAKKIIIQK